MIIISNLKSDVGDALHSELVVYMYNDNHITNVIQFYWFVIKCVFVTLSLSQLH
jgi:hypothetical protein